MAIELNNGRAAQMGILGLMVHEGLNNDPYVLNSLLGYPGTAIKLPPPSTLSRINITFVKVAHLYHVIITILRHVSK